jgi:hypothetical protein
MSEVSIEGLRQAFLDSSSRIRLNTDPVPEEHTELEAIAWEGGFLDGSAIHFNENLNVLIGGRGTGKSTVIESIREVLDLSPVGDDAKKVHDGIVKQVLKNGTKISLLVRSYRPSPRDYLIERTIPNPPVVRDSSGNVLNLGPREVAPRIEIYGQHEISELSKSEEKLTRLLDRFVERSASPNTNKREIGQRLVRSRTRFVDVTREKDEINDRLAALPGLEETLTRFQEAGLEDKLREQSLLIREERILATADERLAPIRQDLEQIKRDAVVDVAFLSTRALADLPGAEILAEAEQILIKLTDGLEQALQDAEAAVTAAQEDMARVRRRWSERKASVQAEYERILRELQKSRIDGEEFIRLRRQIEELRPLRERLSLLDRELTELQGERRNLLAEWDDLKRAEYQELNRAAQRVNRLLTGKVRVEVKFEGDRKPLLNLLRSDVGGRLSEAVQILETVESLSLRELADACRTGTRALSERYGIVQSQAERLAQASEQTCMAIEELFLPHTTQIQLNVSATDVPTWRALDELSTGQRATAILLLLLLESDAPLIVDQPEDDLDNRFISEAVVPKMRDEKTRRQFIFSTHNANVPVLGDAELIAGMEAKGEAGVGRAIIRSEFLASIDSKEVRELVEELLEGGKEAFEMRRLKYGF